MLHSSADFALIAFHIVEHAATTALPSPPLLRKTSLNRHERCHSFVAVLSSHVFTSFVVTEVSSGGVEIRIVERRVEFIARIVIIVWAFGV